jgi:serralysin
MADILAVQNIYGAAATRTGDSVYGFHSNLGSFYDFNHYTTHGAPNAAPAFTIYDSGGNDTLDASGFTPRQTLNLQGGSFSSVGSQKNNVGIYTTSVIENAVGGSGNDTITGNNIGNVITGNAGFDRMTGLAGADTFIFFKGGTSSTRSTADTITDFRHTDGDIIDFTHRDANSVLAGDQAFAFIGNQAFHKVAGELHYIQEANDTWIEGDTNGNGKADFIIHLNGSMQLQGTDFHL